MKYFKIIQDIYAGDDRWEITFKAERDNNATAESIKDEWVSAYGGETFETSSGNIVEISFISEIEESVYKALAGIVSELDLPDPDDVDEDDGGGHDWL